LPQTYNTYFKQKTASKKLKLEEELIPMGKCTKNVPVFGKLRTENK